MHPGAGGPAIILKNAGTDATMGFVKAKHSPKAMALRDGPPRPRPALSSPSSRATWRGSQCRVRCSRAREACLLRGGGVPR
jgi:hypothetical protein